MLVFRPLPFFSFAAAVLFASLVSLGVWQLDRLQWKLALIARVDRNMHALPLTPAPGSPVDEYRRVAFDGSFDNAKEAYAFGTDKDGAPVYHVIVPFKLTDGRTFLVDRGIVPKEFLDPATRRAGEREGETRIVGIWRTPDAAGVFTPKPDLAHRIWYSRDVRAIAKSDGVTLAAPIIIEADASPNPGFWPKGGQTVVAFRNEHLQYAITWFALAAALLGVYLAYHVSRKRLAWR
jgi:surfeit locus 1 family protein